MPDFFDRLEFELTDAARRQQAAVPTDDGRSRRRRIFATRPLLAAGVGLVLASSATAGIITLAQSQDSAPLRGSHVNLPASGSPPPGEFSKFCHNKTGSCPGRERSTTKYSIALRPFATSPDTGARPPGKLSSAGQSGWCVTVELVTGQSTGSVIGCSPTTTPEISARVAGAGFGSGHDRTSVAVVDERVAAVRLRGGRVIVPRQDRALPNGWRAAVWSGGSDSPASVELLDAQGAQLPNEGPTGARMRQVQASGAASAAQYRGCIVQAKGIDLHAVRTVLKTPSPGSGFSGRPFLVCGTARVRSPKGDSQVFVLVDATDPGAPAPNLPGSSSSRTPGTVAVGADSTARRQGNAWVVVTSALGFDRQSSKTLAQQREDLLDALHLASP
jgi:hypothetical protein